MHAWPRERERGVVSMCSYGDDASSVPSFSLLGVLFVDKIKGDSLTHRKENNNNRQQNDNNMKENMIGSLVFKTRFVVSRSIVEQSNRGEKKKKNPEQ